MTAGFSASPLIGTAPLTVTFTDQSGGAVDSLHWDYGDGATSTTSALTHTHPYTQLGTYTVTLTVNGLGGTDAQTATIRVVTQTYTTTTRVITYTYDKLYRLTDADYSSGESFAYGYDPVGNRTVQTRTLTATTVITYAYDAANRLDYFYEDGVLTDLGRQSPPLDSANLTLFVQIFFCDIICSTERSFPSCEGHTWFNLLGNSTSGIIQMWSFSRV